jgi:hypothetical protein
MIDRVVDRLSPWKGQLLNHNGRLELIRSTLTTMAVYIAICIGLPPCVIKALKKILKVFQWSGTDVVQGQQMFAAVGTLRTGHPRVQALSQDNGSCLPTRGSSGAATYPRGSGSRLPARCSSGATTCHLGSSSHLLAQGSSGDALCPKDGFCRLQANKHISYSDPAIMITIGARARVSSKTLCDKGCSARSQGVQQATH